MGFNSGFKGLKPLPEYLFLLKPKNYAYMTE